MDSINFDLGDGNMEENERVAVPASEEGNLYVQLLHERGYQCIIHKHELPWKDWYAINNEDGTVHCASQHPDLFESIANAMLMEKLGLGGI
jgi:hypothetical protein